MDGARRVRYRAALIIALLVLLPVCITVSVAADDPMVYVTRTGERYHRGRCSSLRASRIPLTLSEAISRGYTPCGICDPPTIPAHATVPVVPGTTSAAAAVRMLSGQVIAVADGDTLTMLAGTTRHTIRLNGIDTPERGQPFGSRAKQALADLCFGVVVEARIVDTDRFGRLVADLYVRGQWINAELVRLGMAWHYTRFSDDQELARLEREARAAQRGLWADSNPMPPWEFRR